MKPFNQYVKESLKNRNNLNDKGNILTKNYGPLTIFIPGTKDYIECCEEYCKFFPTAKKIFVIVDDFGNFLPP